MRQYTINFKTIANVQEFCKVSANFDGEIDIVCDRFCIDGKSVFGIFSLDLTKNLTLNLYAEDEEIDNFYNKIVKSIVVEE